MHEVNVRTYIPSCLAINLDTDALKGYDKEVVVNTMDNLPLIRLDTEWGLPFKLYFKDGALQQATLAGIKHSKALAHLVMETIDGYGATPPLTNKRCYVYGTVRYRTSIRANSLVNKLIGHREEIVRLTARERIATTLFTTSTRECGRLLKLDLLHIHIPDEVDETPTLTKSFSALWEHGFRPVTHTTVDENWRDIRGVDRFVVGTRLAMMPHDRSLRMIYLTGNL